MIEPWDHQEEQAELAYLVLQEHALVYLAWEERTGKSLTGCLVCEQAAVQHVLVITKKKAKEDWDELVQDDLLTKRYEVITYGRVKSYTGKPDLIILDEAHNYISGYPKPSTTWKAVVKLTRGLPLIYMSATPNAQGYQLLYHQFALSTWSPWAKYPNFYNWFKTFARRNNKGELPQKKINGRWVNQYEEINSDFTWETVKHLFITKTRKELGFEHEPKDKVHYVELSDATKLLYNQVLTDKVLPINGINALYDTSIKERSTLHMIEGGTIKNTLAGIDCNTFELKSTDNFRIVKTCTEKIKDAKLCHVYYVMPNDEKIQYILDHWGDADDICIMYNFIAEEFKLRERFKHACILQATSNAEGIDLSHKRHLIVYSQDYSTARHTQRRARQANMHRKDPIEVHFLLAKKAISCQVYKTVSLNKKNFVDSTFERELL